MSKRGSSFKFGELTVNQSTIKWRGMRMITVVWSNTQDGAVYYSVAWWKPRHRADGPAKPFVMAVDFPSDAPTVISRND